MRHRQAHPTRPVRTGLCIAFLVATLTVALPGLALAHDALVASDPPDGAALTDAPAQVTLTFSGPPSAIGSAVAVTGADGSPWADGSAVVADTTVTQALVPGMPSGAYTVDWRSVATDGHPVSGTFTFTVEVPAVAASPAAAAAPAADASADPAAQPTGEPSPQSRQDVNLPRSLPVDWLVAGLAVVLAGVVAAMLGLRRRNGAGSGR